VKNDFTTNRVLLITTFRRCQTDSPNKDQPAILTQFLLCTFLGIIRLPSLSEYKPTTDYIWLSLHTQIIHAPMGVCSVLAVCEEIMMK